MPIAEEDKKWLIDLGITKRKSHTLKLKKPIPKEYQADFIRGVFDGDGMIGYSYNRGHAYLEVLVSASNIFVEQILKILHENNIFQDVNISFKKSYGKKYSRILVRKKKLVKDFYDFIYKNNPTLYLERKRKKFDEILQIYGGKKCY